MAVYTKSSDGRYSMIVWPQNHR